MEHSKETKQIIEAIRAEEKELSRKTNVLDEQIAESEKKIKHLSKIRKICVGVFVPSLLAYNGAVVSTAIAFANDAQNPLIALGCAGIAAAATSVVVATGKWAFAGKKRWEEKESLDKLKKEKKSLENIL